MDRQDRDRAELLELYKMAVEMADRVSARRGAANAFFITVQSALTTAIALVLPAAVGKVPILGILVTSGVGILLAATWLLQLRSYRDLNTAKFQVIQDIEKRLSAQPFADEWQTLKGDRVKSWRGRYAELGFSERVVPVIFIVLYGVLAVVKIVEWCTSID